jgi:hypothetical protein
MLFFQTLRGNASQHAGSGSIVFTFESTAEAVLAAGPVFDFRGHQVKVIRPQKPTLNQATVVSMTNLYIKQLPHSMTESTLRALFEPFGPITSSKLILDTSNVPAYAFVDFVSSDIATKVLLLCIATL